MKKVLVLGAGMVSRPLVRYLLECGDIELTVASRTVSKAEALLEGHANGRALALDARDQARVRELVPQADLTVSLLPPEMHVGIAGSALAAGRHFVTTSYISDAMRALDGPVRDAGLTFLNEAGLDPGIDHMSALRVIHGIQGRGGAVTSFRSYCGALPAPEADTNPWGYKFSWSPRGVILAGRNEARYLEDGEERTLPGERLFSRHWPVDVRGFGEFEAYFNRDSIPYIDTYGLEGVSDMFRATLRYPGWSYTMQKVCDLGYFDLQEFVDPPATYAELARRQAGIPAGADVAGGVAAALAVDPGSDTMKRLAWLGLFTDEPVPWLELPTRSPMDALAGRMLRQMPLEPGERDLCVMQHEVGGRFPDGHSEQVTSTLIDFGDPGGDSSIARTVGLPAAIAVAMILDGRISDRGVFIPVSPSVYTPILAEMERLGVSFEETVAVL